MQTKIRILLLATLYTLIGKHEITLEIPHKGETVKNILFKLIKEYPTLKEELGENLENIGEEIQVLVNGRNIEFLQGLDTTVKPGDTIVLIPPAAGG